MANGRGHCAKNTQMLPQDLPAFYLSVSQKSLSKTFFFCSLPCRQSGLFWPRFDFVQCLHLHGVKQKPQLTAAHTTGGLLVTFYNIGKKRHTRSRVTVRGKKFKQFKQDLFEGAAPAPLGNRDHPKYTEQHVRCSSAVSLFTVIFFLSVIKKKSSKNPQQCYLCSGIH